jgi:hypothetical protein
VGIRVRIYPPHPLLSSEATNCGGASDENGKNEVPWHNKCGAIKIPPCSKTGNEDVSIKVKILFLSQYGNNSLTKSMKQIIQHYTPMINCNRNKVIIATCTVEFAK